MSAKHFKPKQGIDSPDSAAEDEPARLDDAAVVETRAVTESHEPETAPAEAEACDEAEASEEAETRHDVRTRDDLEAGVAAVPPLDSRVSPDAVVISQRARITVPVTETDVGLSAIRELPAIGKLVDDDAEPAEKGAGDAGRAARASVPVDYDAAKSRLLAAATHDAESVCASFGTGERGLSGAQVEASRKTYGSNAVSHARKASRAERLLSSFKDPFTMILVVLAIVSFLTDFVFADAADRNATTAVIIVLMVLLSGILRFVQEGRSADAVQGLLDMIKTTTCVEREDGRREVSLDQVVVGDLVHVAAGDMIPADLRIIASKDLMVSQGSLTGESVPVYKTAEETDGTGTLVDQRDLAFMGSDVVSGGGTGIVIATGASTMLGAMSADLQSPRNETVFDKGVASVSQTLIRFMLVMAPSVFVINWLTKGDWFQAALFAVSVAVGLTPEMLPMLVTTCLAKGAVDMSRRKVIIKRLDSIENLGSIDILCTDKTGTLNQNKVVLERHLDLDGKESVDVLRHAFVNSSYQTGLKNLMDEAIIDACGREAARDESLAGLGEAYVKIDEVPFDFERRRMSVLVSDARGKTHLITKGALEEMLGICTKARVKGRVVNLTDARRKNVTAEASRLARRGMRVLAVAEADDPDIGEKLDADDEREMTLLGYLAFLDPPKESSAAALESLKGHGVTTKILTGDSDNVTRYICKQIGIQTDRAVLGSTVDSMSDAELARRAERATIFAKLSPEQKARVVRVLRENGHAVGYMGDGVNDAAAMKESDCGISVDTAVDIAKESADIILLEKDLDVLDKGIIEGRRTYGNMIKYIKMTASSNFGNIFSVVLASIFLPFLPMAAIHLLLLNLIYDICCCAIPFDNVDDEFLAVPHRWDAGSITRFMTWMGPTSSVFDIVTFVALFFVICPAACGASWADASGAQQVALFVATFQAGWFIESMWTQTTVIHLIRTARIPFVESRASAPVILATLAGALIVTAIPFTPLGALLGFSALPTSFFVLLPIVVVCYVVLETVVKKAYIRHFGELL